MQQQRAYLLLFFMCSAAVPLISGGLIYNSGGMNSYSAGDVSIVSNASHFKCDKIFCPQNAYRCYVEKQKTSPTVLVRKNICYASDNTILLQNIVNEASLENENVFVRVDATRNGIISAVDNGGGSSIVGTQWSEEDRLKFEKELQQSLSGLNGLGSRITQQVQANLNNLGEQLNAQFGSMFGGFGK